MITEEPRQKAPYCLNVGVTHSCRQHRTTQRWFWILVFFAAQWFGPCLAWGQESKPKSVLLLYSHEQEMAMYAGLDQGLRSALESGSPTRVEFYAEYLDLIRFPDRPRQRKSVDYLRVKYADRGIVGGVLYDLTPAGVAAGRVGQRVLAGEKPAERKEWAGDLAELTKQYITPSPAVLQAFFGKATAVPAPGGLVQLYAESGLAAGDKLVYEIEPQTQALQRYMFHTSLEGDPVDGQVEFARLPDGLNYAARTMVNVPAKQVSAKIENFEYAKQ